MSDCDIGNFLDMAYPDEEDKCLQMGSVAAVERRDTMPRRLQPRCSRFDNVTDMESPQTPCREVLSFIQFLSSWDPSSICIDDHVHDASDCQNVSETSNVMLVELQFFCPFRYNVKQLVE